MRYVIAVLAAMLALAVSAQTFDCTVSCTIRSDAFPPSPSDQPAQCQLYDGAGLLATAPVAGPAGALYCMFTQQYAQGRAVSLTAKAIDGAGVLSGASNVVAFTSGSAPPPPPPPSTIPIGETTVLAGADSGNANSLLAQNATLGQTATLQSLSFYVASVGGNLRLGIYDATGPGGGPGKKITETASFTPVAGWNTKPVLSAVTLSPGTYWIAYLPSSNALAFRQATTAGVSAKYYGFTFGTLPATFATAPSAVSAHWSMYATLVTSSAPPPAPANICVAP